MKKASIAEDDPLATPSEVMSQAVWMRAKLDEFEIDGNFSAVASLICEKSLKDEVDDDAEPERLL